MVAIKYDALSEAFDFVSSAAPAEHEAYIDKETGNIYWVSDLIEEELPEDLDVSRTGIVGSIIEGTSSSVAISTCIESGGWHFTCVCRGRSVSMPQGDKRKYTDKQKRQAEHIEEGYKERGLSEDEAERRAWATVNKVHGGGEKPGGGGYGKPENREPMRRGARKAAKKR